LAIAFSNARMSHPSWTKSEISAARQRQLRASRTGLGKRPQLNNFQTWRELIRSAAETSFTFNSSIVYALSFSSRQFRAAQSRPSLLGAEHQHFECVRGCVDTRNPIRARAKQGISILGNFFGR
jgi:macrodomain Ter protein organizer (MatP/YcbG family)